MGGGNISYQPTDGLTYDPSDPKYWDEGALDQEIVRVFEVCHGCRMCFKYCDSFPLLFARLDETHDGDVRRLTDADKAGVMDACFQCKLCEVQCPYTPRDGHEFQLDFPKLVHRFAAIRARRNGVSGPDRVLGDPDTTGKLARASLGVASAMNRVALHRWFLEKVLGIHRDKLLPDWPLENFEGWAEDAGLVDPSRGHEVVLFQTCYVEHNEPHVGKDTIEVLERNGVDVGCSKGLRCCGMPAWEHGDLDSVRANMAHNLDILDPRVRAGAIVLAINPTCSMMMRREWPELADPTDRERAGRVAGAVMDPSEYLWSIRKEPRFNTDFKSTPGPVAYHAPCHLRAQAVGFRGRDLIRQIPGTSPDMVMECCGHDGTRAMKVDGFEYSQRVGKKAFDGMKGQDAAVWATDCPLAALQFEQHAGKRPLHPMSLLARAYRADGFETALDPETDDA